ncbi:MAG: exonuclease subunit SbcD [Clostridiales bacterium]|nr:exonuclease subunit SbcD [Clostridiales bacterium]
MKILHTADWHLGAYLGNFSRIDEQALFLQQLCRIVDENGVDMVIIAGDIYDFSNPPAAAEALFYSAMARLHEMKVPVVAIAGNHDSAERLDALTPMISELGVHIFANPGTVEIKAGGNGQSAIIAAMPFISEKRLNEAIFSGSDEAAMQKQYSAKIGALFSRLTADFRQDTVNIAAGHFHIAGGEEAKGLERDIQLGGVFAVNPADMPAADYIAMGHLHRAQRIKCGPAAAHTAHYAGSPLPYSLSERGHPKSVNIVDILPGRAATVDRIFLDCPKPIEIWTAATAPEAIEKCRQAGQSSAYKYIVITEEPAISAYDIKEMRGLAANIVSIELAADKPGTAAHIADALQELSPREEFANFYAKSKGTPPGERIVSIFDEVLSESDEEIS